MQNNVVGGFGGGGGAEGYRGGGGGGGYAGGGSGADIRDSCGGGGGSYNDGDNQENKCCYDTARHGQNKRASTCAATTQPAWLDLHTNDTSVSVRLVTRRTLCKSKEISFGIDDTSFPDAMRIMAENNLKLSFDFNRGFTTVDGEFGGGGGAAGWRKGRGGGGGGYSEGSSGADIHDSCGDGGGSYNDGNNQDKECCYNNAGHGHQITVTFLE
ncbi:hypothetical protein AWC38_SpisGene22855 [Stylophora pistillata]|uniref:Uncharacterized protein n=1 Tax=Stylophora pistillata TaxID=50429 RepID=A0A2B4R622_STYPI|nr:hypothetical protein AWC38_SpisGene22855 [Stylophora pistillata]